MWIAPNYADASHKALNRHALIWRYNALLRCKQHLKYDRYNIYALLLPEVGNVGYLHSCGIMGHSKVIRNNKRISGWR